VASALTLALKVPVRLLDSPGLEEAGVKRLGFPESRRAFLEALARGGSTEAELCASAPRELGYLLARLEQEGWICHVLARDGRALATLEPLTPAFRFRPPAGGGPWRMSRFAWIRRTGDGAVLEHPLGLGRVMLHEPALLEPLGRLATPQDALDLGLAPAEAGALLALLGAAGAAAPCGPGGELPEDLDPALRQWEFHDLLFHSRSRQGTHGDPVGGTFRFLGELDPLPALPPAPAEPGIQLPEPRPGRGRPFFNVLEARRSIRAPGRDPISLPQLGAFLHHVARVRGVVPPDPQAGRAYEAVSAPCPGGGALHEIELYLTVSRCAGLEPGFYHYAAGTHALEPWPSPGAASGQLLLQAQRAMGAAAAPDILFTLAARVQRVAWKYQSIAYALILKNTGVLYQQMYLVATALGLAPCALGAGDTRLFAQASGLAFTRETSVGEFTLSGR